MYYSEQEARVLVLEACRKLVEKKLIARTWGNISARISETECIITPSGLAYDTLKEEQLVKVKLSDLSYEGAYKPSSEKGIHAFAYLLRPDIRFVIHTHQFYASAVGAEGRDAGDIPCAAYGLPGTGKLKKAVARSIAGNPGADAFLMAHHGALCLGKTFEAAFEAAEKLEEKCRLLYEARLKENGKSKGDTRPWLDDYAQIVGFGGKSGAPAEDAEAVALITEKNKAAARYVKNGRPLGFFDALLQHFVYQKKYSKLKNRK